MTTGRDQTLTAVKSPLATEEQRDIAVLLMVGSAENPGLPANRRLQIVGNGLEIGRRPPEHSRPGVNVALLDDDTLVSGHHARIVPQPAGTFDLLDLGSKNGTWVDNARIDRNVTLRDGALVFVGNHVGIFRVVSALELEAIKNDLVQPFGPVATSSPTMALACDRLRRLAPSEGELLIVGETGVGKEVYARAVHQASVRKGRFIAINCAAIPRELVESELFGYRQGAHSTAHQAKPGLIEEAEGGTLFLDEIGEMSTEAQTKLLRFLQDREMTPLGATRPRRIDVRIVAATNRSGAVSGGTVSGSAGKGPGGLRDDMIGRLGAAPIHLPPLRNRLEDLGALCAHFLRATPSTRFEQPAFRALCLHGWPLNVRELEKIVSTAAVLAAGQKPIALRDLPEPIARAISVPVTVAGRRPGGPSPTAGQLEELLRRYDGNVAEVSRDLGKHRAAVWRWIKKFGLGPQNFRPKDRE
jgi:transcriptional regulator with PAS, ATPase and Fis domain